MDMQNVTKLNIPEGEVRTIHDKDGNLIWGKVNYNVKYKGDTSQQAYTGKNLFNLVTPDTNNGVTVTANADGSFTLNGTTTGVAIFNFILPALKPAGTYTISCTSKNQVMDSGFFVRARNQNMGMLVPGSENGPSQIRGTGTNYVEKTFISTDPMYCLAINLTTTGMTYNNMIIYPQVEAGSSASSFEPYAGGVPAPNPDYPQAVKTVTGENVVKISDGTNEQSYEVNLGKNLFDGTIYKTGYMLGSDGSEVAVTNAVITGQIKIEPNTTYTASAVWHSGDGDTYIRVGVYDGGMGWITRYSGSVDKITITTPANARYIRLSYYATRTDKVQLEVGSQATSYAPYFTPVELCKIGDYQDYIYKSGGKWYVHKATNTALLDGSEQWEQDTSGGFQRFNIIRQDAIPPSGRTAVGLSTHFHAQTTNGVGAFFLGSTGTTRRFYFYPTTDITTIEYWLSWLNSQNVKLIYPLATPTDTEITNQALVAQLEAVNQWTTRYGYNASVTGNLPIIIDRTQL